MNIPPPGSVRIAAILLMLQGLGLVALAVATAVSGVAHGADALQLAAQVAYFVVLGALLGLVASGLLRGRRWGRTPALVAQAVLFAVGMWMAFPSAQVLRGAGVMALGALTFAMLVTPRANHWIRQFPMPFGIGQDR